MFRILVVCTANICRSPATAAFLRVEVTEVVADGVVQVDSAGVAAVAGVSACDLSSALVTQAVASRHTGGADPGTLLVDHRARGVTPALVQDADLVLALERFHRAELARLAATTRPKTFTLRQAAALSGVVGAPLAGQELPAGAPPMPHDAVARLRWWVGELDAARALAPRLPEVTDDAQESPESWHPDDVPDPHVLGSQIHSPVVELAEQQVLVIASAITQVLAFDGGHRPADH